MSLINRITKYLTKSRIRSSHKSANSGQSLVEMAIILPLLLLMLLGVFEVGWTLRGYLTLVNANREAARFASRGVYLNFNEKNDPAAVGFTKIVTHTLDTLANQLSAMDFVGLSPDDNASMIATYYSINPGVFTCPGDPECLNFDCSQFLDPDFDGTAIESGYDLDDINDIEYPILTPPTGYESYDVPSFYNTRMAQDTQAGLIDHFEAITSYAYHTGGPYFSRIDPREQAMDLRLQSNNLNCELRKKGLPESDLKVIVIENIFNQNQLVGLPFVTAFVPNPIPLYTHTVMRINPAARQAAEDTSLGCALYPIMLPSSMVNGKTWGTDFFAPIVNDANATAGSFGFVYWDGTDSSAGNAGVLADDLLNPTNALTNYKEPGSNPLDTTVNIGDWIKLNTGVSASVTGELEGLRQTDMLIPIWSDTDCLGGGSCLNSTGSGNTAQAKVFTFARVILKEVWFPNSAGSCSYDFPGMSPDPNKCLEFTFVGFEPNACPEMQEE